MSGKITTVDPILSAPAWAQDYFDPDDAVVRFPASLDPSQFEDVKTVKVTLTAGKTGGTREMQRVTINATGGTFTVTVGANTTPAQAWNVSTANLKTALNLLASVIALGGVDVVGVAGATYDLEWGFVGDVAQVTADGALLTGGAGTAVPSTLRAGVAADTTLAVTALSNPIPSGTVLDFGGGLYAKTAALAAKSATSITVLALVSDIPTASIAWYRPMGTRKQIPSGTLVGRTFAERDAGTAFGPAVYTDDEVFLILRPLVDAAKNSDIELYKPGRHVKENYLPDWATISTNANLLAKLRAVYITLKGVN